MGFLKSNRKLNYPVEEESKNIIKECNEKKNMGVYVFLNFYCLGIF